MVDVYSLDNAFPRLAVQENFIDNIQSRDEGHSLAPILASVSFSRLDIQFPEPVITRDILGGINLLNDSVHSRGRALGVQDEDLGLGDGGYLEADGVGDLGG